MQEERERNKNELLQQEKDQEAKISAYQNAIMERAKEEQEEKARVDAERKRRWEVVVKETRSQTQSREEFESLRKILWEEELEAREVREETERAARAAKQKEEMMLANQAQLRAKQELIKAQEEEEREMVQTMLIKFAEDEAAALTEHERERAKQVQFVSVIQGQREDKVRRAEAERAREVKEMEQDVEREKYKKTVVAEARKRLLEKHAAKLQGYLPKGVLLDQDEVAHLRKNSFKTFWKDLQKNES
uniref:Meiosis-specific nuclear structural protein 1 n=1 Tax=Corethron hystrix TaxID=216773 RepID=A0A7S1B2J5_9STRA|mmetsp:Transcript_10335/g.22961  ORF Transcript_10335/g.22961 Transcript_10335/m.22961 type:complete len:248 (+) Transcript_10335:2-745(+)